MIQWRIDYDADNLLKEYVPPRALLYYIPSAILKGYDKEGDPIYLERGGVMDGVGLQRYSRDDIVRHIVWLREIATTEYVNDYERAKGQPPKQVTIIYDLKGLNSNCLKHGVIPMFRDIVKVNQQRYCGLAKRIILLRAPSVFNFLWNIAKHFFPPEAVKLMVFTGPNNYMQVLDKYIDREVLPPCICKEGRGGAIDQMPQNFSGGTIPPHAEASIPDEPWITNLFNTAKNIRKRDAEREELRNSVLHQKRQPLRLNTPSPVCLSEFMDVKVLHIPQPQWDEEFETVLVR
jgi:CRAL/TRIO domain